MKLKLAMNYYLTLQWQNSNHIGLHALPKTKYEYLLNIVMVML